MPKFSAEAALARLTTGSFLVAREVLRDPNFEGTILLLCAHEGDGDYGLVLNRASHMPLAEVFESLPPEMRGQRSVNIGGPVEQDKIQILDWSGDDAPESQEVVPGLAMGGHWDFTWKEEESDFESESDSEANHGKRFHLADSSQYRIFLGYSGWGQGQLTNEIELGAWQVFEADVFATLALTPEEMPKGEEAFAEWAMAHPPRSARKS